MDSNPRQFGVMANVNVKKDKNQNIQVFVRLRPINNRERELKSLGVVEVANNKDVLVKQHVLDTKHSKKFTFDRAFGPNSKQVDVYQEVVSPLIEEVLAGYNCTVFAYGQTGTGKTHTMVGESSGDTDVSWQNDPMAGIIPRSLSQLFDELRITNAEYTVRVSYLELYNEELFDLLSSSEDNSKLRIYEDATRKGSNIVNGLEEMTVYNKNEVYKIMAKGQEKRRIASTLMNAQSSRSHTVFTIIVHMKENSPDGEELMKVGKLNLVDLAGSENISKAGSDNPSRKERARECVNINQSLLTLGRVITCLVERHPHIPYRESKLTRLLQESLGGRTKTSIIATISPGHRDVEETLSTLEYAYRARNIQNKPEINQKMTKIAVLKDYAEQIDRLKRDLQASRERNGIFLAHESYNEIQLKLEEQNKEIQEQILYIKAMKEEKERIEGLFNEMSLSLKNTENELSITNQNLDETKNALSVKKQELATVEKVADEQKHLVSKQVETEKKLTDQAKNLLGVTEQTTTEISFLHNTVEKKIALENNNLNVMKTFGSNSHNLRLQIKEYLNNFTNSHIFDISSLQNFIEQRLDEHKNTQISLESLIKEMVENIKEYLSTSEITASNCKTKMNTCSDEVLLTLHTCAKTEDSNMNEKMQTQLTLLAKLDIARENDRQSMEQMKQYVQNWKDASAAKMASLRHAHTEWWDSINEHMENLIKQHNTNGENTKENNKNIDNIQQQYYEDVDSDMNKLKALITSMEEKHSNHKSMLKSIGQEKADDFSKSHAQFSTMLHSASEDANSKIKNVNNIVDNFNEINESSAKDITVMIADYKARVDLGKSIDIDLKNSQIETASVAEKSLTTFLDNTTGAINKIKHVQEETIADEQSLYYSLLTNCCNKSDEIMRPIEFTMKNISDLTNTNKERLQRLQCNITEFRYRMDNNISANENMESIFLNHEYKMYSPTGKTPMRKDYAYPKHLVYTSPHEKILSRYRNLKSNRFSDTSSSNQEDSVIDLDPSIELTPLKRTPDSNGSDLSNGSIPSNVLDNSIIFMEPKPVKNITYNGNTISKAISENDLYTLADNNQFKENNDSSTSDKKDLASRLKQPLPVKKILGNKNN